MGKRKYIENTPTDIAEWLRLIDLPKAHPDRKTPVHFYTNFDKNLKKRKTGHLFFLSQNFKIWVKFDTLKKTGHLFIPDIYLFV